MKDRIRTSLWLAPSLAVLSAITLALLLVSLDPKIASRLLFEREPDSARELLSTIASSMLTFTALVFSITVLVLQLASNQFSPRVIRTFLQARVTKLTMAMFVGTFVYAIVVLAQIQTAPAFVPALATWIALVFVVVSVGVFIEYIHHIAHSVRAISVIGSVSAETRNTLEEQYPVTATNEDESARELPGAPPVQLVHQTRPGVLAAVQIEELVTLARAADAVIEVVPRVGDFVPTDSVLLRVWMRPVDDEAARSAIAIEPERTPVQDVGFGIRQLVDIGVRALSPGVNDPTTAIQAIDHVHDLLRRLTTRAFPASMHADDRGKLRLRVGRPSYADLVDLAFDELFHYASNAPHVRDRLRSMLADCLAVAPPDRRGALNEKLAVLDRTRRPPPRRHASPVDRADFARRVHPGSYHS